ncbi:unnamed protein product [Meganyctiphanes norvegica]|uniref:Zonadhesin n=1 Tax=Meganyctiphanes norvegica TaxID=48144 RepID=A0AAV2SIC6_MEGNR
MQSLKVLVVLVAALSQVECAPSSILPAAHRFSPPEVVSPFKHQPAAPSPFAFFTNFPGPAPSPSEVALSANTLVVEPVIHTEVVEPVVETVVVEPVIDSIVLEPVVEAEVVESVVDTVVVEPVVDTVIVEPESVAKIISKEPVLPVEFIVPEVFDIQRLPQPLELVVTEAPVEITTVITAAPVEIPTVTTAAPATFQETEHYKAYEQFIKTWLQQASLTLNKPELLTMVSHKKQSIVNPNESPVKPSVSKSVEKSVEKVVEQVTVSESVEPHIAPVEAVSPVIDEVSKKISGPPKKTPATIVSQSSTDAPVVADIDVIAVEPSLTPEPVPSPEFANLPEPLESTIIASEPTPESLVPSLVVAVPSEKQEDTIVSSVNAPKSLNSEAAATPELLTSEPVPEHPSVQERTIFDFDLVAEPSFLQPVVVSQPAIKEFILAAEPQITKSSPTSLTVSPEGTIMVASIPHATSSSSSNDAIISSPFDTAFNSESLIPAQPSPVETSPEPAQSTVIESFSPQGLTYTLKYFPKQGSSFFYSHALGG